MGAEVRSDRETSSVLRAGDEGTGPFVPREKDYRAGLCAPAVSFLAFQDMFHDTTFVFLFLSRLAGQCILL